MSNVTVLSLPSFGTLTQRLRSVVAGLGNALRDVILAGVAVGDTLRGSFYPAAEMQTDGEDVVVRLELPGVDVDNDVHVEVEGTKLVIHGERRDEHADSAERRAIRGLRYGPFRRSFTLPADASADSISTTYDAGVLTVRVAGVNSEAEEPVAATT
jgi:HSP20 family protein